MSHRMMKRWSLLLAASFLTAAACSSPPAVPDDATLIPGDPDEIAVSNAIRGIPEYKPLILRDAEPRVLKLGQVDDVQAFRVGEVTVLHKITPANSVVAAQLYIRGGSANLTEHSAGIEQLAMGVAVSGGTHSTPKDQFNAQLDSVGSVIGSFVDRDYSGVSLRSVVDHFDQSWDLFVESVFEPAFPKDEVELNRERQLAEIKRIAEDPDSQVGLIATEMLFDNHPYKNFQHGTQENVRAFTAEELKAYQRGLIAPERMLLVVVGNLPAEEIVDKVKQSFGRLAPSGKGAIELPPFYISGGRMQVEHRELPTNYIFGLFSAPKPGHEDHAAFMVATRHLRDRLFEEVRTKRNLTYAVSAGLSNKRVNYGLLYVTAVDPGTTMPVIFDEVEKLKTTPLSPDQLEEVRNVFLTRHYMDLQTNSSQASMLAEAEIIGGDWRNADAFLKQVEEVTPADIQRVAATYFQNYNFAILGNPELVSEESFGMK